MDGLPGALDFHVKQRLWGASDGCNTHTGTFRLATDGSFTSRHRAVTVRRCPASQTRGHRFANARVVRETEKIRVHGRILELLNDDGAALGRYRKLDEQKR